ncbi:AMP-binding protein, partial [Hansschlegelia beijingensis]|uniref:AMP-binding protein n=1 Tax=Hansschlegelia beijingensis TaxID=1133344 RepID=UPI00387F33DF
MSNWLFDAIRAAAPGPSSLFLETSRGDWTYADLFARSARLANALVAMGVAPGERVAVQVEKSAEALTLYLACVRAGAVYLPLNTGYTPTELDWFRHVLFRSPNDARRLEALDDENRKLK